MNFKNQAQASRTPLSISIPRTGVMQRRCTCGQHTPGAGECRKCAGGKSDSQLRSGSMSQGMMQPFRHSEASGMLPANSHVTARLPSQDIHGGPVRIPAALPVQSGYLRSPFTSCEQEQSLKTSPPPGGGILDPLEREQHQALHSWIVGGMAQPMKHAMREDSLLGSWVVGEAASAGINTIKCDGSGGIVVQAQGTGNAAETACLKDCIVKHEESHKADALAANAKICDGAAAGNIVTVDTAAERKATEVKASNVEIDCLRARPETAACKTIIANRITQMIAYRDSF